MVATAPEHSRCAAATALGYTRCTGGLVLHRYSETRPRRSRSRERGPAAPGIRPPRSAGRVARLGWGGRNPRFDFRQGGGREDALRRSVRRATNPRGPAPGAQVRVRLVEQVVVVPGLGPGPGGSGGGPQRIAAAGREARDRGGPTRAPRSTQRRHAILGVVRPLPPDRPVAVGSPPPTMTTADAPAGNRRFENRRVDLGGDSD